MSNIPKINVSLDIERLFVEPDDYDGDPQTVQAMMRKAVLDAAAEKLLATNENWGHDLRQEVDRLRNDIVRQRVTEEVDKALSAPVQRTTQWGEKRGEPTTVLELIRLHLEEFLNGRVPSNSRNHYENEHQPQNLADVIKNATRDTIKGPLAQEVAAAREVVREKVKGILLDAVSTALVKDLK